MNPKDFRQGLHHLTIAKQLTMLFFLQVSLSTSWLEFLFQSCLQLKDFVEFLLIYDVMKCGEDSLWYETGLVRKLIFSKHQVSALGRVIQILDVSVPSLWFAVRTAVSDLDNEHKLDIQYSAHTRYYRNIMIVYDNILFKTSILKIKYIPSH